MIHHSCDRCKRMIDPAQDVRYVVNIEIETVLEPALLDEMEPEDDRDHLGEIQDMLDSMDLDDYDFEELNEPRKLRYDLCPECYRKYLRDPLSLESHLHVDFSTN